ncbi:MAG: peptidoglycan DD-metalloendopeptidase family protein [Anaerovorax sp.]
MKQFFGDFFEKSKIIKNKKIKQTKKTGEISKDSSPIFAVMKENIEKKGSIAKLKEEEEKCTSQDKRLDKKIETTYVHKEPERQKAIREIEKIVEEKIVKVEKIQFEEYTQDEEAKARERLEIEDKIRERRERRQKKGAPTEESKPSDTLDRAIDRMGHKAVHASKGAVNALRTELKPMLGKISRRLAHFNGKTADVVENVDIKIGALENRVGRRTRVASIKIRKAEKVLEKNKRKVGFILAGTIVVAVAITLLFGSITAYEYMYNGKVLGIVKEQDEVYKTIDAIGNKLTYEHGAEIHIDKEKDITFNRILSIGKEIDEKDDVLNRLTYMKDIKAKGYAISIDGTQVAILASEEEAKHTLDAIQKQYTADAEKKYDRVSFVETVLIEVVETKLGNIQSPQKAKEIILTGSNEEAGVPGLTVKVEEEIQYKEPLYYGIVYKDTQTKYKGENTVKSQGQNGERQVTAKVTSINGKEIARQELSATVLSEPVDQVVLRGMKELPLLAGTGTFVYPIRGTITSRFGYRWGSFHPAVDIAAPTGTPIKASDGGTVRFAGQKRSYGYLVEIDHGGNRVTRYAHCSKLFVKAGDKVYQGMHIANVGSTGDSTGPHVHFEVLINGVNKNPLSYL